MTRQLQVEETLRRAEKLAAMGRVAGIVAHEINNPLDAVTNTFYLLRDHPSLDEDARYLARIGEQELARISHITKQTLSFYRESSEPVLLSIADVIDDVLELQARMLQLSSIRLQKDYRSRGLMHGFPGELKQVFLNLIGNAIQATPAGGRIRVRLRDPLRRGKRTGTCITIGDTGSGISPEHARRLFEPFFTTKSAKGTGLGLWISKGIIQKYEGTIQFRSMKLSSGNVTCFSIFIPGTAPQARTPELLDYVKTQSK
jgi:signal transduction histidine kinase